MTLTLAITANHIHRLDLAPVRDALNDGDKSALEQAVQFKLDYPREEGDPRELSEIPEIRLWFLRLDSAYPWLPYALGWKEGELGRYTAMLVPHQFHPTDGIQFNPEALELFVMQKLFVLAEWLPTQDISARSRLQGLAQMLGYDIDDSFFDLISA
ncbi:MAG: CRR6 family NdhI maturation factor [Cyanobacteria bacterium P01_H01_bin.130]